MAWWNGEAGQWSLAITTCWNPTIIEIYWIEMVKCARAIKCWARKQKAYSIWNAQCAPLRLLESAQFITASKLPKKSLSKRFNNFWLRFITPNYFHNQSNSGFRRSCFSPDQWEAIVVNHRSRVFWRSSVDHNESVFLNFFNFTLHFASYDATIVRSRWEMMDEMASDNSRGPWKEPVKKLIINQFTGENWPLTGQSLLIKRAHFSRFLLWCDNFLPEFFSTIFGSEIMKL